MSRHLIFWPALAQILLVMLVYLQLARVKGRARASKEVDLTRSALFGDAWPEYVVQVSNNVRNQFELPVLFYALTFILWAADGVSGLTLGLAVAFVATRFVHAYIHIGPNVVPWRLRVFTLGVVILLALLIATGWALAHA